MERIEPGEMVRRLIGFIRAEGRFDSVAIENFRKMPGGASREIWSFDCAMQRGGGTTRRAMVLRRDPGAHNISTNRRHEFMVIRAAFEERIPVPEVFWVSEDPAVLGSAFFIMERIDGETLARRLLRDDTYARAREVMPIQLADILAKIHRIDPVKHKLDFLAEPGDNAALTEVKRYEENFRRLALEPHPAFELAFRWLLKRFPKTPRKTLVHGDYRIGNVIFGPEGVRSILDWELAHLGDPMEDVGWMCVRAWRFGNDQKPVGGLGTREDFFRAYEKASGIDVDPEAARFWEVFGNLRWGIITISQARTHIDGFVKSVELASIGRRTAETELELLNLIE
ncbi:MAG TPA: phosphotransferase family protein [Candidatus Binatus sp.]|uniref:phosphotransferase family protein n=1 Tax=Candidatus Binatus sp. TaxID=2811406 RepID=UPI002F3E2EBA